MPIRRCVCFDDGLFDDGASGSKMELVDPSPKKDRRKSHRQTGRSSKNWSSNYPSSNRDRRNGIIETAIVTVSLSREDASSTCRDKRDLRTFKAVEAGCTMKHLQLPNYLHLI